MAEVKIKLSQAQAGKLYMKAMKLEEENKELLARIGELELKIQSDLLDHEGYAPKTDLMGNHLIGKS